MNDTPMTIIGWLDHLITKAMKEGDKDMLSIYRIAKTEMIKKQKEEGVAESAIDSYTVYKSLKKKLLEEIEMLEKAERDATVQRKQLDWVVSEMPKPVTEDEIMLDLLSWLPEQAESNRNIGFIMQHLKLIFHGKDLDGKLASTTARKAIELVQQKESKD